MIGKMERSKDRNLIIDYFYLFMPSVNDIMVPVFCLFCLTDAIKVNSLLWEIRYAALS